MDPVRHRRPGSGAIAGHRAHLSHGSGGVSYVLNPGPGFILMTMVTLTTGTAFIMWLGEQITDRGIGNGMSLLIFAGIVVGLPRGIQDLIDKAKTQAWEPSPSPR